ncbi:MAG: alpha/beta fold hydrolase [Nanoarchaeota archaeon]|nr:alpha/beta fold hydrolase [Nanoarchaeota archaeon]MBU2519702.1 alpha/beta fold hydrolase [Nanoarchaeota archaeon]
MSNINFLHEWTKDGLNLQGVHWESKKKDVCIVCIHGMSGNIIENYFAEVLGQNLSKNEFGFIFGHNRGYNHINDIKTRKKSDDSGNKTKRIGVVYERFEESVYDIDLWVNTAKRIGYKKIILMGHSLGCNKVINYYSKKNPEGIVAIILASPPDMVGLTKIDKYQPNHKEMLQEAKKNVANNEPRKILDSLWEWYWISSQTFLDISEDNCSADNLPLLRNPASFPQLAKLDVPILAFSGENDDIAIRSLKKDLELIEKKAVNCPNFTSKILKGANHNYENKENELANMILNWIKKLHI